MNYAIVDTATGRIVQTCETPDPLEAQAVCGSGQHSVQVPGHIQSNSHYISANEPVAFAPSPTPHHIFNWSSKQWEDPRTLQDHKAAKWKSIKASRESVMNSPLATPYGTFDCSLPVQKNITDAVLMLQTLAAMGTPTTIDFTLADNTTVTLTTAQMVTVGLLMGQRVQAAHATARTRRAAIEAAASLAALDAIAW